MYPKYRLFVIGFTAALALVLWLLLERTTYGAVLRAGTESTEMVSLLGIDVFRIFSLIFALGAFLAGLAGGRGRRRSAAPSRSWGRRRSPSPSWSW